jgi:hypothetical protein
MSGPGDALRFKAKRCRELSRGQDADTRAGLLKLAGQCESEAAALEAAGCRQIEEPDQARHVVKPSQSAGR